MKMKMKEMEMEMEKEARFTRRIIDPNPDKNKIWELKETVGKKKYQTGKKNGWILFLYDDIVGLS